MKLKVIIFDDGNVEGTGPAGLTKIRFSKNDDNKLIKTWSELTCLAPEFNLELSGHWLNVVVILSPIPAIESFNLTGIIEAQENS